LFDGKIRLGTPSAKRAWGSFCIDEATAHGGELRQVAGAGAEDVVAGGITLPGLPRAGVGAGPSKCRLRNFSEWSVVGPTALTAT
jgi:hypothetical protein